jgi:dUTP pyrophosphatase
MSNEEKEVVVKFKKTLPNAVIPTKAHPTDEGYDLTIVKLDKKYNEHTFRFDTGIAVQPPPGYHTRIVPRSSLSKTGYVMTNSIGIIDQTYTGNLLVCVTAIDNTYPYGMGRRCRFRMEDHLPYKGFQLLIEKSIPSRLEKVDELDTTKRGDGGFGSTDKKAS